MFRPAYMLGCGREALGHRASEPSEHGREVLLGLATAAPWDGIYLSDQKLLQVSVEGIKKV